MDNFIYNYEKLKKDILTAIIIVISIVGFFILSYFRSSNNEYDLLPILPLLFSLLSALFFPLYRSFFKSIFITFSLSLYFFRSVILPILILVSNYRSLASNANVFKFLDESILLQCYELIIVFITLSIFNHNIAKKNIKKIDRFYSFYDLNRPFSYLFIAVLLAIAIITLSVYFNYPQLKYNINIMIEFSGLSSNQYNINFNHMINSVPTIYYRIFQILLNIIQIIIPLFLLKYINLKFKKKTNTAVFLSIIVLAFSFLLSTSEKAFTFFISITLLLMIYLLYPQKIKRLFPLLLFTLTILVFAALFFKTNAQEKSNPIEYVSIILQGYFSGPVNLASAIAITNYPTLSMFFNDILKSSLFTSYFFQSSNSIDIVYNYFFYGFGGIKDQIIPLTGQAYFYFGFLLSPIYVVFFIIMGFSIENLLYNKFDILSKGLIIYFLVIVSVTPFLYNLNIFIAILTNRIIPVFLIFITNFRMKYMNNSIY